MKHETEQYEQVLNTSERNSKHKNKRTHGKHETTEKNWKMKATEHIKQIEQHWNNTLTKNIKNNRNKYNKLQNNENEININIKINEWSIMNAHEKKQRMKKGKRLNEQHILIIIESMETEKKRNNT